MKYEIKDDNLIVTIPLKQTARDYYDQDCGKIDNIIGVISKDQFGNEEIGFHQLIDMTYKGKESQIDGLLVPYYGEKEDFIKLCKELGISYYEYPTCVYCGNSIYGSFSDGDKGPRCYDCEKKAEKGIEKYK